jgi:hypothetical protein
MAFFQRPLFLIAGHIYTILIPQTTQVHHAEKLLDPKHKAASMTADVAFLQKT